MPHPCTHCGNPLSGPGLPGRTDAHYCCYGCLRLGEQPQDTRSRGIGLRLGIGLLVVGQSMIFGLALNLHDDVPPDVRFFAQTLIFCATLIVIFLLGGPLLRAAWQELRRGRLTIEALFLLTFIGALGASLQAHITGRGKIYFEVVSVLLVVYTLGKVVGGRSRATAVAASRAWSGQLGNCRVLDEKGLSRAVPAAEVRPGDRVQVYPGEMIAVDGIVRDGTGFVAEAAVTGEPFAVVRRPGDRVLAGAASHDATFRIEATAAGTERQVDRLLAVVEAARDRPLSLQARADALGRVFLPLIVVVAIGTFAYWADAAGWEIGLFNAMSVLLVACPCAIGLATPIVTWAALSRLAERGVIVRSGDALERLAAVDRVVFDKTGTLTEDRFAVRDVITEAIGNERAKLLGWLALVERCSSHPVAKAFAQWTAPAEGRVLSFGLVPGCGVVAEIEAEEVRHVLHVGRLEWVASFSRDAEAAEQALLSPPLSKGGAGGGSWLAGADARRERNQARTPPAPPLKGGEKERTALRSEDSGSRLNVGVALDGRLAAIAHVAERLRDSTTDALIAFERMGLPVEVLTGDSAERAAVLNLRDTRSRQSPDDKRRHIETLMAKGYKPLVVGDGLNDAAALAAAHVGVALASGADLAVGAAAVTLYHGDLRTLPWAVALSREAVRTVKRNLYRALAYNVVGMALAAGGVLHPVAAALLMAFSSLSLVFSSSRVGSAEYCGAEASHTATAFPAFLHGLAFALQGVLLVALLPGLQSPFEAAITIVAFAALGFGLAARWHRWTAIPHALDMGFGMLTLGNLGMLLGWWADLGFGPVHCSRCCSCSNPLAFPGMTLGMVLFANAAMLWLGRQPGTHSWPMLTGGNVGMVVGMFAGGRTAEAFAAADVSSAATLSFLGMTAGMLAGMAVGTWCATGGGAQGVWRAELTDRTAGAGVGRPS